MNTKDILSFQLFKNENGEAFLQEYNEENSADYVRDRNSILWGSDALVRVSMELKEFGFEVVDFSFYDYKFRLVDIEYYKRIQIFELFKNYNDFNEIITEFNNFIKKRIVASVVLKRNDFMVSIAQDGIVCLKNKKHIQPFEHILNSINYGE